MKTFHLKIITPKGIYLDKEVEELYLNTSLGYMGVLAKHDTLISGVNIAPGFIKINNKREYYAIFSGVLNILKDEVKLIVSNIEEVDKIDVNRAKKARDRALDRLKSKNDSIDELRAELALKRAIARIEASKRSLV